jgi:hypothetical protein
MKDYIGLKFERRIEMDKKFRNSNTIDLIVGDRYEEILKELRGWLIQGIHSLDDDNGNNARITEKINTMKMVIGKIDELERSM